MKRQGAPLSKNRKQQCQRQDTETSHFMGLPCEVWQRVIWPACGWGRALSLAPVSKSWCRLIHHTIEHFSPGNVPYTAKLKNALTKTYLAQFTNVRSFYLDSESMRLASALPALASLPQLRTLCVGRETSLKSRQLASLTRLTALDISYNTSVDMKCLEGLTQLRLLRVSSADASIQLQLPAMKSLTYLNLDYCRERLYPDALMGLSMLQCLSACRCHFTSCDFLTALTSLVFLSIDGAYTAGGGAVPHLLGLSNLTALSMAGAFVPVTTIVAMTQLRHLEFGDSVYPQIFSLEALTPSLLQQLTHLKSLSYTALCLGGIVPSRLAELRLEKGHGSYNAALQTFNRWHHPLPPHFFNFNHSLSPFMKYQ